MATAWNPKDMPSRTAESAHVRDESFSRSRYSMTSTWDASAITDLQEEEEVDAWNAELQAEPPTTSAEHIFESTVATHTEPTKDIESSTENPSELIAHASDPSDAQSLAIPSIADAAETAPSFLESHTLEPVAQVVQTDVQWPEPATTGDNLMEFNSLLGATQPAAEEDHIVTTTATETAPNDTDPFGDSQDDWLGETTQAGDITVPETAQDHIDEPTQAEEPVTEAPTVDDSKDNPFGEANDDWLGGDEIGQPLSSDPATSAEKPAEGIEDSWAKAFGDDGDDLDATWGDAFGDDDEGFLEDAPATQPQTTTELVQTPSQVAPMVSTNRYQVPQGYAPPPTSQPPQNVGPAPGGVSSGTSGMKFFEELPMTQKPRRALRPTTPQTTATPPPPIAGANRSGPPSAVPSRGPSLSSQVQLQPPEKLDLFPPQSIPPPTERKPSQPSNRYSPAPSASGLTPSAGAPPSQASRYSPAPPGQKLNNPSGLQSTAPPSLTSSQQYAPPMPSLPSSQQHAPPPPPSLPSSQQQAPPPPNAATTTKPASGMYEDYAILGGPPARPARRDSKYSPTPSLSASTVPQGPSPPLSQSTALPGPPRPPSANRFAPRTSSPLATHDDAEPLAVSRSRPAISDDTRRPSSRASAYAPRPTQSAPTFEQPPRPRTQSPQATRSKQPAAVVPPINRPASASVFPTSAPESTRTQSVGHVHRKSVSRPESFIPPTNELASDPLERWKGSPIFRWSGSGAASTMFPKRVPLYSGNQAMTKCTPGEVKLHRVKDFIPSDDVLVTFPGPLKSKGKKKELLTWLTSRIETMQRELATSQISSMDPRDDEKLMLWQIIRVFIEHDGVLQGNQTIDLAVRQILAPASSGPLSTGVNPDIGAETKAEGVDAAIVHEISQLLAQGDREKAAWLAVDHRLWGHAMLISSTLNATLWKQIAQEFVRKEVRGTQRSNQSLATLYQTFAGNWEESIDELVPASLRAGFTMMSRSSDGGQQQAALNGLDKWRETVNLILSNRSNDDEKTLNSLGKMLAGYGRTEASHICFLFSKSISLFSGADDPNACFTLVGADIKNPMFDAGRDIDSIVLSQIYEFGLVLAAPSNAGPIPHLQAYKLHYAYSLAESGLRNEAQQYCDAIAASFKSSTKSSAYYNSALMAQLDDLTKRIAQAPKDGGTGLWSRPGIGKVSGSFWNKFNTFVAGDEGDTASTASGGTAEESGTFSKWTGGTPTISRNTSQTNLYGMQPMSSAIPPSGGSSRYAPGAPAGQSASTYSPYQPQQQGSEPPSAYSPYQPQSQPSSFTEPTVSSYAPLQPQTSAPSSYVPSPPSTSAGLRPASRHSGYTPSYEPSDQYEVGSMKSQNSMESYMPSAPEDAGQSAYPSYNQGLSVATENSRPFAPSPLGAGEERSSFDGSRQVSGESKTNGYAPEANGLSSDLQESGYQPNAGYQPSTGYQPSEATDGYEPPSGGYAPPSYVPYEPEPESAEDGQASKPKKKSFMDDDGDEDFVARNAEMKKAEEKARKDRENEELVRKAVEADEAKAKAAKDRRSSGWLGGWFAGAKKDPNDPVIHKAKLGEESSFVFDPETKRWVNKKGGEAQAPAAAAPPPPPRSSGPPSRAVSASGTPPPGMPLPPTSAGPPMGASRPPMGAGGLPPGPPSRIATPGSDAGAPPPPGTAPGPPRPATSASNASSIDDLLGAPAPRKGAAARKGKKRAGYVDVMAK